MLDVPYDDVLNVRARCVRDVLDVSNDVLDGSRWFKQVAALACGRCGVGFSVGGTFRVRSSVCETRESTWRVRQSCFLCCVATLASGPAPSVVGQGPNRAGCPCRVVL